MPVKQRFLKNRYWQSLKNLILKVVSNQPDPQVSND